MFAGYIVWQPLKPHKGNSYVGILPTLSGYRDMNSRQVKFTTNYVPTYEVLGKDISGSDFVKYFPMSEISIASVFDPDIYKNWKR